jgi:RNA polymerase sigma factor (sigma-70 family)
MFLFGFIPQRVFIGEVKLTDNQGLLKEFARNSSEAAFRKLVARYLGLVYSVALRRANQDTHRAEDIAQLVFIDLARLANTLPEDIMLGGWLHRHTCFVASKMIREEYRRQARERQAMEMSELHDSSGDSIDSIKPILDEAITQLGETDRTAILLRFFEQLDFHAVGEALGSSEDAARMRVNRALEKLHVVLKRRGITTTASALSTVLAAHAIGTAPVGLATKISMSALAGTIIPSTATTATTKAIAMTLIQKALIAVTVATAIGTGIYGARQATRLRDQVSVRQQQQAALVGQIDALIRDNENLSNRLAHATQSPALNATRLRELLRLRGEVGMFRRRQRELDQALAATKMSAPGLTVPADNGPRTNQPAPFKLQLVTSQTGEDIEAVTNDSSGQTLQVQKTPLMDHTAIQTATVAINPTTGSPTIDIEFSPEGKELFAAVSKENINQQLAIVVDGRLYASPVIRGEITEGKAQITGSFTEEEARLLAAKINAAIGNP